jgi:predicted phage terminase large subunit-like protein
MNHAQRRNVSSIVEMVNREWWLARNRAQQLKSRFARAQYRPNTTRPTTKSERDLLRWGKKYLKNHFTREPSHMHTWLAARLDSKLRNSLRGWKLNVLAPRGGAKSTLVTLAYVLRSAVTGSEPYIWIVSDTLHQAMAHLDNIRIELIDNEKMARDYSHAVGVGPVWRANVIQLRNGVTIEAVGTGQRIRGRRKRESRPSLIVCDDLQSDRHAESAEQRELTRRWFHSLLMKAGNKRTNILNLATALHREALACELDHTPGWESRVFPAILRWPERMDLWLEWERLYGEAAKDNTGKASGTQCSIISGDTDTNKVDFQGATGSASAASNVARKFYEQHRNAMHAGVKLLWPDEEDLYTLMCQRAESGRTAFDREKQNLPIGPDLCEWPAEYFSDANGAQDIWFDAWPRDLQVRAIAVDPSKGHDSRQGDYSAIVMLGIDAAGTVYVEADMARRPVAKLINDTVAWYLAFRPHVLAVETNQFQELLAGELQTSLVRAGALGAAIVPLENKVNKAVRIRRWGPLLAQRRVRFKAHSASTQLMLEQFQDFPLAAHDDGPDAAEMALRVASEWMYE